VFLVAASVALIWWGLVIFAHANDSYFRHLSPATVGFGGFALMWGVRVVLGIIVYPEVTPSVDGVG